MALLIAVLGMGFAAFIVMTQLNKEPASDIKDQSIAQFNQDYAADLIKEIKITPEFLYQSFEVELKAGGKYKSTGPHLGVREVKEATEKGIAVDFVQPSMDFRALPSYITLGLITVLVIFSVGQSFGLSLVKASKQSDVMFKDVAGNEEAKTAFAEVVDYLGDPGRYEAFGAKFPKGIIMDGPPGTGKTLLAKAIAGEAGASFMAVSGSDFGSMFVSVSGMKVKGIFARASRAAPCVLFIDEIDAIGGHRLSEGTATAREMSSTLNSLLVQMDGFKANSGVVVIAATNRIELLDPALLRSGRFDRHIHVQLPTLLEREAIMRLHARTIKLGDFDFSVVSQACIGMSGADLANVVNQAALLAVGDGSKSVETRHGLQGRNRVVMGDPRLTQARSMTAQTKKILAIHETGHAIVGMVHGPDRVTCISIVPRGKSLGQTMFSPPEEVMVHERGDLLARIRVLLGGRAAEIAVGMTQTTGASDDIARASRIALDYVGQFGMGGEVMLRVDQGSSDGLKRQVEDEANELLKKCLEEGIQAIETYREVFDDIVTRLLVEEEIDEVAVAAILSSPQWLKVDTQRKALC